MDKKQLIKELLAAKQSGVIESPESMNISEEISPLGKIKTGVDAYENIRSQISKPLAKQLNLDKSQDSQEMIEDVLSFGDPVNFIPGLPGAAISGAQIIAGLKKKTPEITQTKTDVDNLVPDEEIKSQLQDISNERDEFLRSKYKKDIDYVQDIAKKRGPIQSGIQEDSFFSKLKSLLKKKKSF